jgi:hypothetical protein
MSLVSKGLKGGYMWAAGGFPRIDRFEKKLYSKAAYYGQDSLTEHVFRLDARKKHRFKQEDDVVDGYV